MYLDSDGLAGLFLSSASVRKDIETFMSGLGTLDTATGQDLEVVR